jgi:WD repeat-containing protein 19
MIEQRSAGLKVCIALNVVKNWQKISQIFNKITNPKIFALIGRAKEDDKNYLEAASAYEKAEDYDSVINILIFHLKDLENGANLVRKTGAKESAQQVAKMYLKERDFAKAIEFYNIAGLQDDAFNLAKQHKQMEYFSSLIIHDAPVNLCKRRNNY